MIVLYWEKISKQIIFHTYCNLHLCFEQSSVYFIFCHILFNLWAGTLSYYAY